MKRGRQVTKHHHKDKHPVLKKKLSTAQKAADIIAEFGGSWTFIFCFFGMLIIWIVLNGLFLVKYKTTGAFDPYPFILLNLVLSIISALQAPFILMSQNRQSERDRIAAKYDYQVNRKAEREVANMQIDLDEIKFLIRNSEITPPHKEFKDYMQFRAYKEELKKIKSFKSISKTKKKHYDAINNSGSKKESTIRIKV